MPHLREDEASSGDQLPAPGPRRAPDLTVAEAGELGLLSRILARIPQATAAELGPGDDAAVLRAADARVVVTTDLMIEGPDFRSAWSSAREVAARAVASNLADVSAMGATPTAITVALALPAETEVAWVETFAEGLAAALDAMAPGCGVIGGDLSISGQLVVAVTAFGDLDGGAAVVRSGARPGDVLALSGPAGLSGTGLSLLYSTARDARGEASREGLTALRAAGGAAAAAVDWHLSPRIDASLGASAREAGATAMMDVSDGLLLDASRLARASGVRLDISTDRLADDIGRAAGALGEVFPELVAEERWRRASELVVTGGEDHGLLAAFPAGAPLPEGFRAIGAAHPASDGETAEGPVSVDGIGTAARGWDPYAWDPESWSYGAETSS